MHSEYLTHTVLCWRVLSCRMQYSACQSLPDKRGFIHGRSSSFVGVIWSEMD